MTKNSADWQHLS